MIDDSLNFDAFMSLPSKERKLVINDPEYLKIMVKKNLKESRYLHSLSVADCARELAQIHKADPDKAYIAGLLHDCTKYLSSEEQDLYLRHYDPEKLTFPDPCKHSFTAKYYLREKLNFHDSDILNAIYNHTICMSKDRLSMILYIADKREPLRGISDDILTIAHHDLYAAYRKLSWDVERYLKETENERFIENRL